MFTPAPPQFNKTAIWLFSGYILALIIWKTALWLHLPLPSVDGVQSLSHTYAILRGDFFSSIFWHNWIETFQLPYGYGVVTAPLMALLPFGTLHNFHAATLLLTLGTAAVTYSVLVTSPASYSRGFAALVAVLFLVHPHFWILRPESITVPLLLLAIYLFAGSQQQPQQPSLIVGAFAVVFAGLTHPIGGLIGVLMVTVIAWESRWQRETLLTFYMLIVIFLFVFYLPVILIDIYAWIDNFLGFFTREEPRGLSDLAGVGRDIARYGAWSAPLLFLYARGVALSRGRSGGFLLREGVFALLFLIPIVLGGGGAYFVYLLVFCVWRLRVNTRGQSLPLGLAVVLFAIAPLWTHYFPTLQNVENPRYGDTVRAIMREVDTYSNRPSSNIIWVSTRAGLPIIDETYSRVLANYFALGRYAERIAINEGDEILYIASEEADTLLDNYRITPDTAFVEVRIAPVPGLLTVESGLQERLPEIGLWRVTLR